MRSHDYHSCRRGGQPPDRRPDVSVLLIGAGESMDACWESTPAGIGMLFGSQEFNWRFDA